MKISILTFSHAENYGAVLQAYALKSYLIKQGHDVSFVFPTINKPKFKDYLLRPFASFHKALMRLNRQSLSVKSEYKDDQNSDNLKKSFRAFQAKTLKLDPDYNAATIRANSDYCVDLFIVGSDQVWAIDPVFYGANFLLDFVDDEVAKISYAASFGRSNLERYQFSTYRLFLNRFRGLSVREPTGVKIIENLGIKGAVTVCDPTILIDDYSDFIELTHTFDDHILVYLLPQAENLFEKTISQLRNLQRKLNKTIMWIAKDVRPPKDLEVVEIWPTVEEFVNHFHHCSVVFTNSYHGTIFGLKFQREIFVVPRDIYPDKQNLRLEYLMRLLSVHRRYIDLNNYETLSEVSDIDYELVEKKLKLFQASGQEFLRMHAPAADE